jgi:hypothetical protein
MIQVQVVTGRLDSGGGGNLPSPPSRGGGGNGSSPPSKPSKPSNPSVNQPTARQTFSQPSARPTYTGSFSRSIATSFSFSRTIQTSYSYAPSITRTFTAQTSYTFSPTFTFTTTNYGPTYTNYYPGYYPGYWYPGMTFPYYPPGYSTSTGSFTLGQTLYGPNNTPCLYYGYFEFNVLAGMTIQARLWTTGPPINYIVVPMSVVSLLQGGNGCNAVGYLAQTNTIGSTPYLYSWTAPQTGQYAVIFYSTSPYTAPVYFLPQ